MAEYFFSGMFNSALLAASVVIGVIVIFSTYDSWFDVLDISWSQLLDKIFDPKSQLENISLLEKVSINLVYYKRISFSLLELSAELKKCEGDESKLKNLKEIFYKNFYEFLGAHAVHNPEHVQRAQSSSGRYSLVKSYRNSVNTAGSLLSNPRKNQKVEPDVEHGLKHEVTVEIETNAASSEVKSDEVFMSNL